MTVPEYEIEVMYRSFRDWVTIEDGRIAAPTTPGSV